MEHQHNIFMFDCRPMKAAALDVIARHERAEIDTGHAIVELHALARSLPDLDPSKFATAVSGLLAPFKYDRARKLVKAIGDRTLRPWVRWAVMLLWLGFCAAAFVGLVALAVWLVS